MSVDTLARSNRPEGATVHPSTENLLRWLEPNPSLPLPQRAVAEDCQGLAQRMVYAAGEDGGAELSAGLRKLLEAKDCFVRASL